VVENNELKGFIYMNKVKNEDGTWNFESDDFYYGGWKEGEDFTFVSYDKMKPLYDAYGGGDKFDGYLYNNDFELETGTDEWIKLTEIIGEKNMPKYIDFLENTLDIYIVQ
jgi:hypothetical protein